MTTVRRIFFVTGALFFAAAVAFAGSNVFTGTGRTQAQACVSASNKAVKFVNENSLSWSVHHASPSTSECSCQGNDSDRWVCQVTVSY